MHACKRTGTAHCCNSSKGALQPKGSLHPWSPRSCLLAHAGTVSSKPKLVRPLHLCTLVQRHATRAACPWPFVTQSTGAAADHLCLSFTPLAPIGMCMAAECTLRSWPLILALRGACPSLHVWCTLPPYNQAPAAPLLPVCCCAPYILARCKASHCSLLLRSSYPCAVQGLKPLPAADAKQATKSVGPQHA